MNKASIMENIQLIKSLKTERSQIAQQAQMLKVKKDNLKESMRKMYLKHKIMRDVFQASEELEEQIALERNALKAKAEEIVLCLDALFAWKETINISMQKIQTQMVASNMEIQV